MRTRRRIVPALRTFLQSTAAERAAMRSVCSSGLIAALIAISLPAIAFADRMLPGSVLVLDQSTSYRPWPNAILAGIRSVLKDNLQVVGSFYVEHLDLYRFNDARYKDSLEAHFHEKYRGKSIDVIVVLGPSALAYALSLRETLWSSVPIVFAAVDDETAQKAIGLPGVTGIAMQMTLANMMRAARVLMPDLKRFAIVGDPLDQQPYYRHFAEEIREFSREFEFIDLMGLSLADVKTRVAALADRTVAFYLGINSDQARTYIAAEVLPIIAQAANVPVLVDVETFLGTGAVGGFIIRPAEIGQEAARLALRVLNGENPSSIPVTMSNSLPPIFDARALQRWDISSERLPPGSELRFQEIPPWVRYRNHIAAVIMAFVIQAALVAWLLYERQRRHDAEVAFHNTMSELARVNRMATAGELSASIAHEVNQPLTGIVMRANAGLRWLSNATPDIDNARAALTQIVSAGHRASDIVASIRAMFNRDMQDRRPVDINSLILTVLALVRTELKKHQITVETRLDNQLPVVMGDRVQLQQVVLNLVMNAIEAMASTQPSSRCLRITSELNGSHGVLVSVEDTGPGLEPSDLEQIFKPLFSTKAHGMGMGLSICRSIIEAHYGRLRASAGIDGGAVFQFVLPMNGNG